MDPPGFQCKQCGNCCLHAHFDEVEEGDVFLWENRGRTDILKWVRRESMGDGDYVYGVWIDPKTGAKAATCPWLTRPTDNHEYLCQIHDVKPTICRYFPASRKHAQDIGCKGFE